MRCDAICFEKYLLAEDELHFVRILLLHQWVDIVVECVELLLRELAELSQRLVQNDILNRLTGQT